MPVVIRRYVDATDRPGMIALYRAAWHAAYDSVDGPVAIDKLIMALLSGPNPQITPDMEPEKEPEMFAMPQGDVALVAVADGFIAGGARGHPRDGIIHLSGMYVMPGLQQRGIGRALLDVVIRHYPDHTAVRADVRPTSTAALQFYTQHGFVRTGTSRADVGGGHWVDVVEMQRAL